MIDKSNTVHSSESDATSPDLARAWANYIETLEDLRRKVVASPQFAAVPQQRARAYHILMEVQAIVYNHALAPRMSHPRIFRNLDWQTDVYSLSGAGPDFFYGTVVLDGAQTYRLKGKVRDSRMLLAQHNIHLPGSPGARLVANYDFVNFTINDDGSFEVLISADHQDGNWIPLERDVDFQWLFFRPLMECWDAKPTELTIERVSEIDRNHYNDHEFDEAITARRIEAATAYARYMIESWTIGFSQHVERLAGCTNVFEVVGSEQAGEVGSPSAEYVFAVFEVTNEEALVITMDQAPNGQFWSYQIEDIWLRGIDFRTRQTTLHSGQIVPEPEGSIVVVLSYRDPGVANWIDASGYEKGLILLRDYCSQSSTIPRIDRVSFLDLDAQLPSSIARVTPNQRAMELARRRAAYEDRYGE